jgi:hypothetical protein
VIGLRLSAEITAPVKSGNLHIRLSRWIHFYDKRRRGHYRGEVAWPSPSIEGTTIVLGLPLRG